MRVFQCDLCGSTYHREFDSASVRSGRQGVNNSESDEFVHICSGCRKILGLSTVGDTSRLRSKRVLIDLLKSVLRSRKNSKM